MASTHDDGPRSPSSDVGTSSPSSAAVDVARKTSAASMSTAASTKSWDLSRSMYSAGSRFSRSPSVKRNLVAIDRFGASPPIPKTMFGCAVTIVFYLTLLAYGVTQYFIYTSRPPVQMSSIKWSVTGGPFTLPLTCFSERCWVSVNYSAEAVGPGADCVVGLPEAKRERCVEMAPGETLQLETCYSQLSGQGVHLHFGGSPRWGEIGVKLGLGAHAGAFGFALTSQMLGEPVADTMAPLRAGVTLLHHVATDNGTVAGPGSERREWFAVPLGQDHLDPGDTDPCGAAAASGAGLSHTSLQMAPDYTYVKVEPPESFWLDWISDIGGAIELFDILFASTLLVPALWLAAKYCHSQDLVVDVDVECGRDADAPAAPPPAPPELGPSPSPCGSCGRHAARGYRSCCRTCARSGGIRHGSKCRALTEKEAAASPPTTTCDV